MYSASPLLSQADPQSLMLLSSSPVSSMSQGRGGRRYGTFFKDLPQGMTLSAGRTIAAGADMNRVAGGVNEVILRWKANPRTGVGWLTFRAGEKIYSLRV